MQAVTLSGLRVEVAEGRVDEMGTEVDRGRGDDRRAGEAARHTAVVREPRTRATRCWARSARRARPRHPGRCSREGRGHGRRRPSRDETPTKTRVAGEHGRPGDDPGGVRVHLRDPAERARSSCRRQIMFAASRSPITSVLPIRGDGLVREVSPAIPVYSATLRPDHLARLRVELPEVAAEVPEVHRAVHDRGSGGDVPGVVATHFGASRFTFAGAISVLERLIAAVPLVAPDHSPARPAADDLARVCDAPASAARNATASVTLRKRGRGPPNGLPRWVWNIEPPPPRSPRPVSHPAVVLAPRPGGSAAAERDRVLLMPPRKRRRPGSR